MTAAHTFMIKMVTLLTNMKFRLNPVETYIIRTRNLHAKFLMHTYLYKKPLSFSKLSPTEFSFTIS